MSRAQLDQMLTDLRAQREETLAALNTVSEDEYAIPTDIERWTEVRRLLLRFGDHMREHATQIKGIRVDVDRSPTMTQRILAESERTWGVLLAATVGLTDEDLDRQPAEGWTIRQTFEHIAAVERSYYETIQAALEKARAEQDQD